MTVSKRFLNYVSFPTMSDESSETVPSTAKQKKLGEVLVTELCALGLEARMDEWGYVYGVLPANTDKKVPVIGLIAHMDTSPAASDTGVSPQIVSYRGGDILLNKEKNIVLSPSDYP